MDIISLILAKALSGTGTSTASDISYDNSTGTGMSADNVQDAIDELSERDVLRPEFVQKLPEQGEPNIIYIVPKETPEEGNYSDEYMWDSVNERYEKVGDTQINPLPPVTSSDNGKLLGVVSGAWDKVKNPNANDNIASAYDSTATYAVGDLVIYNNNLYECNTEISVTEAWDSTHWTQATIAGQLAGLGNNIEIWECTENNNKLYLPSGKTVANLRVKMVSSTPCILQTSARRYIPGFGTASSGGILTFYCMSYLSDSRTSCVIVVAYSSVDSQNYLTMRTSYGISDSSYLLPSATSSNVNNILNVNSIGNYELIKPYIVNFNVGVANGVCSFYDGKRPSDVYGIMYGNGVHAICFLTIYGGVDNVKFLSCKFNSSNNLVAYTFYEDSGDLYYEEFVWSLQSSADSSTHTKRKIKELPTVTSSDEGKFLTVDSSGNWVADDLPDGTNTSY